MRTVFVNGQYLPEEKASVSIFDRGFLFADGVYEVSAVLWGRLVDNAAHLARLRRSLGELDLASPLAEHEIVAMQEELIRRNRLGEGLVYLQITRGPADRDFVFPPAPSPTCIAFTQEKPLIDLPAAAKGYRVITTPDLRWARCDIKTTALLGASMAKMQALRSGADDAWLVDAGGYVTEGSSSNAWIISQADTLVTRPTGSDILPGITRRAVLQLAGEADLRVEERPFSVAEARACREAFITSAGHFVCPVVEIDGQPVADGVPGPLTRRLRQLYLEMARAQVNGLPGP